MSNKSFMDVLKNRRTIYTLSKETTIPNEKIEEIIKKRKDDAIFGK